MWDQKHVPASSNAIEVCLQETTPPFPPEVPTKTLPTAPEGMATQVAPVDVPVTPIVTPAIEETSSGIGKIIGGLCIFVFLVLFLFADYAFFETYGEGPNTTNQSVVVPKGKSVSDIAFLLEDKKVISSPLVFRLAVRILASGNIQAGEYLFTPQETMADIVAQMRDGKIVVRRFSMPEGLTSFDVVTLLENEPTLTGHIETMPDEGSLMPATYHYNLGDSRSGLIEQMKKKQKDHLSDHWAKRAPDLPINTPEEALVLASVVEKETGKKAEERPRVAGVFYNRIKQGMRLQSDPTVIYALTKGEGPLARSLTHNDLSVESPYNTYANAGLPPHPICNPGKAAIEAVLHPEKNDFIYFVADGTGGHAFAIDLATHNKNVIRWTRLNRQ